MSVVEMFVNAYAKMHSITIPEAIKAIEREMKKGPQGRTERKNTIDQF